MEIEISVNSANYGTGSKVGDFLIDGLPDVGRGIEKIQIEMLVRGLPRAPRRQAIDDMPDEQFSALLSAITGGPGAAPGDLTLDSYHEEQRSKGPALTFRRAARRVSVRIISDLSELDAFGTDDVTAEVFAAQAREVVAALEDLPRRIKPGDDFDTQTFLSHIRERLEVLPSPEEVHRVLENLWAAAARRREAMDDWGRLDVDWSMFTPDVRDRFEDPFFFDRDDEEAPHGNDAGADLLVAYLADRPDDGLGFLEAQLRDMGYESLSSFATIDIGEYDKMVIAAVFAELMVRGRTSAELRQLALQALDRREAEFPSPRNEQMRRVLS